MKYDASEFHDPENPTFRVVRFYRDYYHPDNRSLIATGLSLEDAKEHCANPATTKSNEWFDGFEPELLSDLEH